MTKDYQGSCHCGSTRFRVRTDRNKVVLCNCSICRKKGARNFRVAPSEFEILRGQEALVEYKFGTGIASHFFCRHCGTHPYSIPRSAPDMINVNLQCLENLDEIEGTFETVHFDGQHWEQAFEDLKKALS
jgi:hypothetical protein